MEAVPSSGTTESGTSITHPERTKKEIPCFVVDAFASAPFRGNPAGVCPLDEWLPEHLLQSIATEINLAETAFFIAGDNGYDLRWFTPVQEVPLCGHATLAAAFTILTRLRPELNEVHFTTLSGKLIVRREGDWLELDLPRFVSVVDADPPAALESGLGVHATEVLRVDSDPNYYVIVADEETVRAMAPDLNVLATLHPYGVAVSSAGDEADFVSRYFAPSYGIPEDAVTGSIHSVLTPYWAERLGRSTLLARQLSARGGELRCRLVDDDRVRVAGQAVEHLAGTIAVPVFD